MRNLKIVCNFFPMSQLKIFLESRPGKRLKVASSDRFLKTNEVYRVQMCFVFKKVKGIL